MAWSEVDRRRKSAVERTNREIQVLVKSETYLHILDLAKDDQGNAVSLSGWVRQIIEKHIEEVKAEDALRVARGEKPLLSEIDTTEKPAEPTLSELLG